MPNKQELRRQQAGSKSGLIPRPKVIDQTARHEAPPPPPVPHALEILDDGATTGIMPVVTEGEDLSAQRDDDRGSSG